MFGLFAMHVSDVRSYCVVIHSCVVIPHCIGISSCVSSSASRCILTHRETHAWSENASKISSRASSVFASSNRQGAAVERACAAAYMQAKFGCIESVNEQSSRPQGGSEPGRRGSSRAMTANQVHAVAVVGERANSGQRGRFVYTGVPQEYARFRGTERSTGAHQ